jgi:hypothetical protein
VVALLLAPPEDDPEAPPALEGELALGEALELLELLGALLAPLGVLLAPPEAEPVFEVSLELEALEDGLDGVDEAPPLTEPEADVEPLAPEGDDGEVLLGEEAELELDEPGLEALFELARSPPSPHAARPKTRATAPAIRESFMCPPWLGMDTRASCEPGLTP